MKSLLIGVPLHGAPAMSFTKAYGDLCRRGVPGWTTRITDLAGPGISIARNILAALAIKGNHDVLLFLAGDIGFKGNQASESVARVMNHFDRDPAVSIVGGVYLYKRFPLQVVASQDELRSIDEHGLVEVEKTGTDFLAIRVSVFEAIIQQWEQISETLFHAHLPLAYESRITNDGSYNGQAWSFFSQVPVFNESHDGVEFLPEDFFFCRLARLAGFRIHVDASIRLQHWGTHCYDAAAVGGTDEALCTPNPEPAYEDKNW